MCMSMFTGHQTIQSPCYEGCKHKITRFVRCKNRKKICAKVKQSHKTIFMQFGNLLMSTKLQKFHFSQEKMQDTSIQLTVISLKIQKTTQNSNLQNQYFFFPTHKIHNGLQMGQKKFRVLSSDAQGGFSMSALAWVYWPKSPLYKLSLRKTLIKNCSNFILDRIIIQNPRSNISKLHKTQHVRDAAWCSLQLELPKKRLVRIRISNGYTK